MAPFRWRKYGSYLLAFAFAATATAWVAGGELLGDGDPEGSKPPAQLSDARDLPQVRVRNLAAEPFTDSLTVQGRSEAARTLVVRSETHGRIVELLADKGDIVSEGELLARLTPQDRPARLREAQARVEQRRIELDAAEQLSERGHRAQTQLAEARAAYQQALAQLEQAEMALSDLEIRAPFAARVDDRMVELGDYLKEGADVLRLVDLDPLKAVAEVSERAVGQVQVGASADLSLISGERARGTVTFVASEANENTRSFRVEIAAPNAEARLRAGVTTRIDIPLDARPAHRVTPALLALSDTGTLGVKAVDGDDTVVFHEIDILRDGADGMWVAGLPERIDLITVGQDFVEPGQRVRPVPESAIEAAMTRTRQALPAGVATIGTAAENAPDRPEPEEPQP